MHTDDNTIKRGTPDYNQYLMGIAGGLTKYGSAPVSRVNIEEFKADLEKRFMLETVVETEAEGKYTIKVK